MIKQISILAVVLGAMPIAAAQTSQEAKPFSIAVVGPMQPSAPTEVSYPYLAAERGMDGTCDLAMYIDQSGAIADIEVQGCSSPIFVEAAEEFIERQATPGQFETIVRSMPLRISWSFDDAAEPTLASTS